MTNRTNEFLNNQVGMGLNLPLSPANGNLTMSFGGAAAGTAIGAMGPGLQKTLASFANSPIIAASAMLVGGVLTGRFEGIKAQSNISYGLQAMGNILGDALNVNSTAPSAQPQQMAQARPAGPTPFGI